MVAISRAYVSPVRGHDRPPASPARELGEDQNTRRTGFLTWEIEQVRNAGSRYAAVLPVPVGAEPSHHGHRAQAEWRQPEWRSGE